MNIIKPSENKNRDWCIVNVAIGEWYPKGQERLIDSIQKVGTPCDILTWTNEFPKVSGYDEGFVYNCKGAALEYAYILGYKKIIWLDSSVWALRGIKPIMDIIERDGYYFIDNKYNLRQTCSDRSLQIAGLTRGQAEKMIEVASGIFGIDTSQTNGALFLSMFIRLIKNGAAIGSKLHDNQSADPNFLFHRQDQSVASLCYNLLDFRAIRQWGQEVEYYPERANEKTILTLKGM